MKKILFILFVITTIVCGQARYTLPDSIVAHRAELNAQDIRVAALELTTSSHTSTLSSHTSSISNLSLAVNAHDDSVDALRDDIQALDDSIAVHLDTLQALRVGTNTNSDSLGELRSDLNNIVSAGNVDQAIQDSIKADTRFFSISVTYPQSTENRGLFLAPFDIAIDKVSGAIATDGGTNDSVKVNIRWGNTRATATSELFYDGAWINSTTGESLTADIYDNIIDENKWIWFVVKSKVGVVTDLTITVEYHKQ